MNVTNEFDTYFKIISIQVFFFGKYDHKIHVE